MLTRLDAERRKALARLNPFFFRVRCSHRGEEPRGAVTRLNPFFFRVRCSLVAEHADILF